MATVNFNNTLKRGTLIVTKTSEDGLNEGVKFHLYGTSLSGLAVDEYAVTDSTGKAVFSDVLIGTGYTLEEVDTAIRYVVPANQTAAVEWNTVTNKSFTNILKKWNVTVTKSDAEMGLPQGDATLAGAVYGIYKGDQLVDTYTTDANGQFTTKYYVCGDDWTIREITPSEGYLLDSSVYPIGAEAVSYTHLHDLQQTVGGNDAAVSGGQLLGGKQSKGHGGKLIALADTETLVLFQDLIQRNGGFLPLVAEVGGGFGDLDLLPGIDKLCRVDFGIQYIACLLYTSRCV